MRRFVSRDTGLVARFGMLQHRQKQQLCVLTALTILCRPLTLQLTLYLDLQASFLFALLTGNRRTVSESA